MVLCENRGLVRKPWFCTKTVVLYENRSLVRKPWFCTKTVARENHSLRNHESKQETIKYLDFTCYSDILVCIILYYCNFLDQPNLFSFGDSKTINQPNNILSERKSKAVYQIILFGASQNMVQYTVSLFGTPKYTE